MVSVYKTKTEGYDSMITRWQRVGATITTTGEDMSYEAWCGKIAKEMEGRGIDCEVAYRRIETGTARGLYCAVIEVEK